MAKTRIIYHANCNDGFCAAWVAWRKFGDEAIYTAASYGDNPPDVTGQEVYILDFSYPLATIRKMQAKAESILILDHHKTAQADLEPLVAEGIAQFDMERSGAMMAWDHFFPMDPAPWIVAAVQDRDLWRWKLPSSREINADINTWPHGFDFWDEVYRWKGREQSAAEGEAVCRYIDQYVAEMYKHARRVSFAGYDNIAVVNAPPKMISELLNKLAATATFALGWFQGGNGKYYYSLRSIGDFDVSEVAKALGGGGHKNAAGFVADELIV